MIHVLLGPDRALANASLKTLLDQLDADGDNTSRFESPADSISDVSAALATRTFFSDARVVVATGFLAQLGRAPGARAKRNRNQNAPSAGDQLEGLIEMAATQGVLVFFEPDIAALPAHAKTLLPPGTDVKVHQPARGTDLIAFTQKAVAERGATIDRRTTQHLLERLFSRHWRQADKNPVYDRPPDIEYLLTEIDKLATASGGSPIDESLVDELTPEASDDLLFTMLDAIVGGNATVALREIEALPHSPEETSRSLAMINQQIEFAAAAVAPGRPADPIEAGKALAMPNPNRMSAVLRVAGPAAKRQPALIEAAIEADRRLKTGQDTSPEDSLYRLISGMKPSDTR